MTRDNDQPLSTEAAFAAVLDAESDALDEIAACEARAEEILQDARRTVRGLVRNTQERISRLHVLCAERTRELVTELERQADTSSRHTLPDDGESALLREAVDIVARELTEREGEDAG